MGTLKRLRSVCAASDRRCGDSHGQGQLFSGYVGRGAWTGTRRGRTTGKREPDDVAIYKGRKMYREVVVNYLDECGDSGMGLLAQSV